MKDNLLLLRTTSMFALTCCLAGCPRWGVGTVDDLARIIAGGTDESKLAPVLKTANGGSETVSGDVLATFEKKPGLMSRILTKHHDNAVELACKAHEHRIEIRQLLLQIGQQQLAARQPLLVADARQVLYEMKATAGLDHPLYQAVELACIAREL